MDKLDMQSLNMTSTNIEKIAQLFPNVITEKENEKWEIVKAIDFDLLKQQLSTELVEDENERYSLNWPGKKASILKANTPINKTLRPIKEDSVNFDETENLYIEWDNFEVLKLLQESYLWKVKMIYIDPPYNTGKDFVYKDDFKKSKEDYEEELWIEDEETWGKLFRNTDTNGRFHSDWLSMMYERLTVARDLLKDDGVIFISIDDNEIHNLRKIADEIFGEENFVAEIPRLSSSQRSWQEDYLNISHDYILVYSKNKKFNFRRIIERNIDDSKIQEDWVWKFIKWDTKAILAALSQWYSKWWDYDFEYNWKIYKPINKDWVRNRWLWTKERMDAAAKLWILVETKNTLRMQVYLDKSFEEWTNIMVNKDAWLKFHSWDFMTESKFSNSNWTIEVKKIFNNKEYFNNPKPIDLIINLLKLQTDKNDIILDFFSWSATTAHATMQFNSEDGWNRKFIMVQIPEETEENSEAYKAWYKNICEIWKERIRRAGKKILEENKDKLSERETPLDTWFRVYRLADSNMKDVFYHPTELWQQDLFNLESNIKEDRNSDDLLTQVMLDLWLTLGLPIETKDMNGNHVYFVQENLLVACFDDNVNFEIVDKIAESEPMKVVFKDSSFRDDKDRINFETRFKRLSPNTVISVI